MAKTLSSTRNFIKKNWRVILEVLGLLGIIIAIFELSIQRRQFEYEQLQKPEVEYYYNITFSETDQQAILQAADQLIEDFYDHFFDYRQSNPSSNHKSALATILPMTSTIPSSPITIEIAISNNGIATATDVRLVLEIDRPITSIDIDSTEIYEILQGGIGETLVVIEIDRIVTNNSVFITIGSEEVVSEMPSDRIILKMLTGGIITDISYDDNDKITSITKMGSSGPFFPELRYIPVREPIVRINVTSREGPATLTTVYKTQ